MGLPARGLAALLVLAAGMAGAVEPKKDIPRIIFDSDMSSDHDDVGDIACLHGLASLGECQILGMMVSSRNGGTALCMDAINTWYGKPDIPIGVPPDVGGLGEYAGQIGTEYPHDLKDPKSCPVAADLYRQILAAQPDRSVTIVTTGYLVNVQALMQSGPDKHSPLSGMDLIRKKVKLLSCAAGCFPRGDEFNLRVMPEAAHHVVNNWPSRVMYVGYDVGQAVYTCGRMAEAPANSPIRRVYVDIKKQLPYPSWGQIMVYFAVRESEGLWGSVTTGRNTCDEKGGNAWVTDSDPNGDQDQGYLLEIARTPARGGLDAVIMLPPNDGKPSRPGEPSNLRAVDAPPNGASAALNNHVTLNNDSQHGQDLSIELDVGARGWQGNFHVYFLWQDKDNWYRLNVSAEGKSSRFEKSVKGTITQIGADGPGAPAMNNGSPLQRWQITLAKSGALRFIYKGRELPVDADGEPKTLLEVTDTLSFTGGKAGLGGWAQTPVWENVRFVIPGTSREPSTKRN